MPSHGLRLGAALALVLAGCSDDDAARRAEYAVWSASPPDSDELPPFPGATPPVAVEIRDQRLVSHHVGFHSQYRLQALGDLHGGVVVGRGARKRQELIGRAAHRKTAPIATEHHVARVASGEEDPRLRKHLRDERQLEGVQRMLVDENLALGPGPFVANPPPIGGLLRTKPTLPVRESCLGEGELAR